MKNVTGHVLPAYTIIHVGPDTHIFNGSDQSVYVELTESGELHIIQPPKSGNLVIKFGEYKRGAS